MLFTRFSGRTDSLTEGHIRIQNGSGIVRRHKTCDCKGSTCKLRRTLHKLPLRLRRNLQSRSLLTSDKSRNFSHWQIAQRRLTDGAQDVFNAVWLHGYLSIYLCHPLRNVYTNASNTYTRAIWWLAAASLRERFKHTHSVILLQYLPLTRHHIAAVFQIPITTQSQSKFQLASLSLLNSVGLDLWQQFNTCQAVSESEARENLAHRHWTVYKDAGLASSGICIASSSSSSSSRPRTALRRAPPSVSR